MKKIFNVFLIFVTALTLFSTVIFADSPPPLMVDYANLLAPHEDASLQEILFDISESRQVEIAIVTTNSTNGKSIMDYADDFYDSYNYGYGNNDDGVLLAVDMGNREWWITTHGLGQVYLDDHDLYMIEEAFIDELSDGDYYGAFSAFANACDEYIGYGADTTQNPLENLGISLIVGFVISLIIVFVMKGKMTTVRAAKNAASYVVAGSLKLTSKGDHYLYSNTVRTPRNTNNSSGRSGGSIHRSSSGRSHGGRGGRF